MIEQLFGSKTRVKLLTLFYSNPNRSFYVREITRKIDEQINSVRRELANLLSAGIIVSDTTNNRLYYEVNQGYEFYSALRSVFGNKSGKRLAVAEKSSKQDPDKNPELARVMSLGNVEAAVFTGQFTRDEASGIDLLIVGDVNKSKMQKFIEELEAAEGKDIRYTVLTVQQLQYRKQINDRFVSNIMQAKKQVLIDKQNIFA